MFKLIQSHKLSQKLSPQQIQLMKLLQLPTIGLEQRIKEEMEINPALEEGLEEEKLRTQDDDRTKNEDSSRDEFNISDYINEDEGASYKTRINNISPDQEQKDIPYAGGISFHELLSSQLGLRKLSEHQHKVANYLIGNLDDDGYLRRDLTAITDDLAFSQNITTNEEELEELLKHIQDFEPIGIGARNLQECLLIQLKRKKEKSPLVLQAIEIVTNHMEEFSKKHYDKITKKLNITNDELKAIIGEILKLNPRPGNSSADSHKVQQQVIPDFYITNENGELRINLNSRNAPDLRINEEYKQMREEYKASKGKKNKDIKEASKFIKEKIDGAKWFIDAIQQRNYTLLFTMNAIMEHQKEYFTEGDETLLKPMILKDIAEKIDLDISTVSRVANSKYVQTPFGTFLLKSFFSESLSTDSGEDVSTREVKKILQNCIDEEDKKKPLTDEKLMAALKDKGYNIARRTIAKYREQLDIPVARLRKQL